jgi:starch synthase
VNIIFAASESSPFVKTGGLADVIWGLSKALVRQGHKVSVFVPFYRKGKEKVRDMYKFVEGFDVAQGWRMTHANVIYDQKEGVDFYFIECDQYFGRDGIYGYQDDGERFAFFDLAVSKAIISLNLHPDIVHVHDWQAALVPLLLAHAGLKFRSVLTIHNPAFQGYLNPASLGDLLDLPVVYYSSGLLRFNDMVSMLKGGIVTCDAVTTVSVTHAQELLNDRVAFNGLGNIIKLREHDLVGIVNGLDYEEFDPSTDKQIDQNYNLKTYKIGKAVNKQGLLKMEGFSDPADPSPVFGLVSRLTSQKGIDRVLRIIPEIIKNKAKLIVLGQGEWDIEQQLKFASAQHPENIKIFLGYNDKLSHMIYAGSDFFLMPSKFEPCGLGQIIAMHYGTLPLVSKVGGLNDTVRSFYDSHDGATGFSFSNWDENCFDYSIGYVSEMQRKNKLSSLIKNAMSEDFSWDKQVINYISLYDSLLKRI